jgi:hypothetical protein
MLSNAVPNKLQRYALEINLMLEILETQRDLFDLAIEKNDQRLAERALSMIRFTCECLDSR